MASTTSNMIHQSLKTLLEMLHDRKINVEGINIESLFLSNTNKLIQSFTVDRIRILYYLPLKFKWTEARSAIVDETNMENIDTIIIVVAAKLSANNLKLIGNIKVDDKIKEIQIFEIKELQYNITKHVLVPKHEIVTDTSEIQHLITIYNIKNKFQFPHILKNDPMSRYLGLKTGDLIRITRDSPTSGEYVAYRVCV